MSDLAELLQVALHASDAADAISLSGFTSRSFGVTRKADNSEVTDIDRATEQAIVASLNSARPDYGTRNGVSLVGNYRWRGLL